MASEIRYEMSPTAQRMHNCPLPIRGMRGPIGSGKTSSCCMEVDFASNRQIRDRDGVRRSRWLVLRNTLGELRDTTIKSVLDWFPDIDMKWTPPYTGEVVRPWIAPDGSIHPDEPVRIEFMFLGCDQKGFEKKLKGLEITGVYANEATQLRWGILYEALGRCGRYPRKEKGRDFISHGLVMDTNSPDDSNWWYKFEVERKPRQMGFFVQPPALFRHERPDGSVWYEPNRGQVPGIGAAENIANLNEGFGYYMKQLEGRSEDEIRRLILNEFGTSLEGKPVYPEWREGAHWSARELEIQFGLPIFGGVDFGRTPACVICQMLPSGRVVVLDELTTDNMGITTFAQELLRPLLITRYNMAGGTRVLFFADPAGMAREQGDELTVIQRLNAAGIPTLPCPLPTNSFVARREAVADLLRESRDGKPSLLVSPRCKVLRKGFNGGYCYAPVRGVQGASEPLFLDRPDKHNPFSHVHDALQYAVYGMMHSGYSPASALRADPLAGMPVGGIDLGGFGV